MASINTADIVERGEVVLDQSEKVIYLSSSDQVEVASELTVEAIQRPET